MPLWTDACTDTKDVGAEARASRTCSATATTTTTMTTTLTATAPSTRLNMYPDDESDDENDHDDDCIEGGEPCSLARVGNSNVDEAAGTLAPWGSP